MIGNPSWFSPSVDGSTHLAPEPTPIPTSETQLKVEDPTPEPPPVSVVDHWRAILDKVRVSDPGLASALEHAVPVEVSRTRVLVAYAEDDFLGHHAGEDASKAKLVKAVHAHFGASVPVHIDTKHRGGKVGSVHAIDSAERRAEIAKARAAVEDHPVVREIVRLFDAELRDIKLPEKE